MTDIDPRADIELHPADEHVTVRVPLAGHVPSQWLQCYQKLALATQVPAQALAPDDRAWIVVSVPASSDHEEVVATLDAARALIAEADAAAGPPATAKVEASVRSWWAWSRRWRRCCWWPSSPLTGVASTIGLLLAERWP